MSVESFSYFQPGRSGSKFEVRIQIHKVAEFRFNLDPDPQHRLCIHMVQGIFFHFLIKHFSSYNLLFKMWCFWLLSVGGSPSIFRSHKAASYCQANVKVSPVLFVCVSSYNVQCPMPMCPYCSVLDPVLLSGSGLVFSFYVRICIGKNPDLKIPDPDL